MYKFCFHNPYSTPETVSFYIHIGHIPTEHDLAKDGSSDIMFSLHLYLIVGHSNCNVILLLLYLSSPSTFTEHLDPINVKIAELREALESVTAEQKYLKARDARHRHSTFLLFSSLFLRSCIFDSLLVFVGY